MLIAPVTPVVNPEPKDLVSHWSLTRLSAAGRVRGLCSHNENNQLSLCGAVPRPETRDPSSKIVHDDTYISTLGRGRASKSIIMASRKGIKSNKKRYGHDLYFGRSETGLTVSMAIPQQFWQDLKHPVSRGFVKVIDLIR